MVKRFPLQQFFRASQTAWANLPDHRKPSPNTKYALSDAVNSAMSMFFMQAQSFLAHHQAMSQKKRGQENLQTLFEVKNVPSDNQIRNLLDSLKPTEFAPQYEWIWQQLSRLGGLAVYKTSLKTRLIALDGMVYHSSTEISCPCCSTRQDRSGKTHYYHATLLPLMVQPDLEHVLACFPEMITPQDGAEKQDCERNAAKRWLTNWSHLFTPQYLMQQVWQPDSLKIMPEDVYRARQKHNEESGVFSNWKGKFTELDIHIYQLLAYTSKPLTLSEIQQQVNDGVVIDALKFLIYTGVIYQRDNKYTIAGTLPKNRLAK